MFSEADFGPTSRTSIFSRNFAAFCKKSTALRILTERQTTSNAAKRRRLYYRPPSKYCKTRVILILTPKKLEKFEVFKKVLPEKGPLKVSLKLKTYFFETFCLLCLWFFECLISLSASKTLFSLSWGLSVSFLTSPADPHHPHKPSFYDSKTYIFDKTPFRM